jgi:biofilm PGA synthesis N-glycosyltransferase PgaC
MIWLLLVLALGVNLLLWGSVGAVRYAAQRGRRLFSAYVPPSRIKPHQVAVLIAAHNEELGVRATVDAAHTQVPRGNVFVVSDGSKDATVATATHAGASVYDLNPNRGKAGALAAAIRHFTLAERFEVVMLLDADTVLSADYMKSSLNMFDDPDVVAIAGRAATVWDKTERLGFVGTLLRA